MLTRNLESLEEITGSDCESYIEMTFSVKDHRQEEITLPLGTRIRRAFYGTACREQGDDVSGMVRRLVQEGKPLMASNRSFKDPVKGVRKVLFVDAMVPQERGSVFGLKKSMLPNEED